MTDKEQINVWVQIEDVIANAITSIENKSAAFNSSYGAEFYNDKNAIKNVIGHLLYAFREAVNRHGNIENGYD